MFVVKVMSRECLRAPSAKENHYVERVKIVECDYVETLDYGPATSLSGRMNDGSLAVQEEVSNNPLLADSEMGLGQVKVTMIIVENSKGKTTHLLQPPRCIS